jgi:hypothetical protein
MRLTAIDYVWIGAEFILGAIAVLCTMGFIVGVWG